VSLHGREGRKMRKRQNENEILPFAKTSKEKRDEENEALFPLFPDDILAPTTETTD
jgi:hypothetical protein